MDNNTPIQAIQAPLSESPQDRFLRGLKSKRWQDREIAILEMHEPERGMYCKIITSHIREEEEEEVVLAALAYFDCLDPSLRPRSISILPCVKKYFEVRVVMERLGYVREHKGVAFDY